MVKLFALSFLALFLYGSPALSEDLKRKCFHYQYDDHGHVIVVEVFHDLHHPHVIGGIQHIFLDVVLDHHRWAHHPGHYVEFHPRHRIHGYHGHGTHRKGPVKKRHIRKKHIGIHTH